MLNKLLSFLILCLYALGTIGGIGYVCYNKAYPIAVGVAALAVMAFPKLKEAFKNLTA